MNQAPWWALSPNPLTLAYYAILCFYGAHKLDSKTKKQWFANFAESAFVLGLVILVFDSFWQIFQWFKFGFLYPSEILTLRNTLIRNSLVLGLCGLSSWKLNLKVKSLSFDRLAFIVFPVCSLLTRFLLISDPVWTDYTYGLRFEMNSPWLLSYLSGWIDKVSLALVYVCLWRNNFVTKR